MRGHQRPGFALLVALVVLLLGGALMLAAALRADADLRAARLTTLRQRAFTTAESALWNAATATTAPAIRALPIGGFTRTQADSTEFSTSVTLVRVDSSFAWIVSAATVKKGNDIAQHRLGMSLRISADATDHVVHEIRDRGWTELF